MNVHSVMMDGCMLFEQTPHNGVLGNNNNKEKKRKKKEEEVQNTYRDTVWGNIIFSWNEWEYSNGEDVEIISGLNIVEQFFDLLIYEVAPHFTSHDSVLEITTEHNKRPFLIW